MASLNTNKLKDIDESKRDLITGFFKQIQQEIKQYDNPYYNTPTLVIYITILYHMIEEYFSICGNDMMINDDKDILSVIGTGWSSAYGHIEIDNEYNAEYIWKFKILSRGNTMDNYFDYQIITFGIDSSNKEHINHFFYSSQKTESYGYRTTNVMGHKRSRDGPETIYGHKGEKVGDIVTMILNTKLNCLSFYHNNQDLGVAFENINFQENRKYHMALFMDQKGASVQLIQFNQKVL